MNWRSIVYFIAVLLLVGGGALTLYNAPRSRISWAMILASCAAVIVATVAIWWFLLRPKWELPAPSRALARGCCGGKAARTTPTTPPAPTTVAEAVAAVEACTALKTSKEEELAAKQTALTTATGTYNALFNSLSDAELLAAIELYRRVFYPALKAKLDLAAEVLEDFETELRDDLVYHDTAVSGVLVQTAAVCLSFVADALSYLPDQAEILAVERDTGAAIEPSAAADPSNVTYFVGGSQIDINSREAILTMFSNLFTRLDRIASVIQVSAKPMVSQTAAQLKDYVENTLPDALSAADAAITATLAAWEDPDTLANITAAGQSIQDAVTSIGQSRLRFC